MKIRQKLEGVGIVVPAAAHSYHTEKGCLVWLPVEGESLAPVGCVVALNSDQYEALMVAGLAGKVGWRFEDAYVEPRAIA